MKRTVFLISFMICLLFFGTVHAGTSEKYADNEIAAGCLPPSSFAFLDISNVRARIHAGGDMWWDLTGNPVYEVPKGMRKHSMFSAALWIGGKDNNGQLKLAALRYRQTGNDFWPGPLTTDGNASIDMQTCHEYDKLFTIYRKDVEEFNAWYKNPSLFPGYQIPAYFFIYPAHGDVTKGQARFLAPFYDHDGNGIYNPNKGDYPFYDLNNQHCPLYQHPYSIPVQTMGSDPAYGTPSESFGLLRDQMLKGDQTIWWVFNDKGNDHTETGGLPIGLEIRAQAFAFEKPQEITYSTFYSYEIINRSNSRLNEVYVGFYTDCDIGYAFDDYIGSDVKRGMGYAYNGTLIDGTGKFDHYGINPPAIGVDFLFGPYMDPDGLDNPKFELVYDSIIGDYIYSQICDESITGQNFGNSIIDDERMGMQRFVYFSGAGVFWPQTVPFTANEYYNYLRGIWKDNTPMMFGGNAHMSSGAYGPECKFMFPGDSDPCLWNTDGISPNGPVFWSEESVGNEPYDRRMLSSAGPFTLEAGAVNYVTIGVPWARASTGGPEASVALLKHYDDKIQRYFDNCFRVADGPDAPDLSVRELDREIILFLTNMPSSNNFQENYEEYDPFIVPRDPFVFDSLYRFEGYMVYQLKNPDVPLGELNDPDKARLVSQCDVQNNITRLVNYYYNPEMNANIPVEEVNGSNLGIVHSFRILHDLFATGDDKRLVNNRKYYFTAIAYGYNEYEKFSDDPAYQFPGESSHYGQKITFLPGRRNRQVYTAIPHIPTPLSGGTVQNSVYGTQPVITRVEGHGNGGLIIDLNDETVKQILENGRAERLTYKKNFGPVDVKVIDPLNVKPISCRLFLLPQTGSFYPKYSWKLVVTHENNQMQEFVSEKTIDIYNEQLILQLGLSLAVNDGLKPGDLKHPTNGLLFSDIEFASGSPWLTGLADQDVNTPYNWIRAGTIVDPNDDTINDYDPYAYLDPDEHFEKILGGTWAPYRLVSRFANGPAFPLAMTQILNKLSEVYSIDVVFTSDKSKWSRCPVIETGEDQTLAVDNVKKGFIRQRPSLDKDGNPDGTGTGMGWFPGYAINVETGERLNVMFGESSWLAGENGNDMRFNPTYNVETAIGEPVLGGKHFLYIFGNFQNDSIDLSPAYDEGIWTKAKLDIADNSSMRNLYRSIMWVSIPLSVEGTQWLQSEAKVRIRVSRPYQQYFSTPLFGSSQPLNGNHPVYEFSTHDLVAATNLQHTAQSALQLINIVPNPYYAHSDYGNSQDQQIVKITNLPDECTVTIFNTGGTLVRQFRKNSSVTWIEWDLKNEWGKRIAGGMYLIHVVAPGFGERTLKWFGSLPEMPKGVFNE
jgi:hypothetical protein